MKWSKQYKAINNKKRLYDTTKTQNLKNKVLILNVFILEIKILFLKYSLDKISMNSYVGYVHSKFKIRQHHIGKCS